MPNHQVFSDHVNEFFDGDYSISTGYVIPDASDIQFGKVAKEMDLAMLFIDLRESTKIVDGFRRQTAAKMYKSFLWGVAKIAKENSGELRSFNGDGVLVVFSGADRCEHAVTAAMQMSYFVNKILKPKFDGYMARNNQLNNMSLSFGIGIDTGTVLIVKGGVRGENNNDLVWVGNATNYAVKLSNIKRDGQIRIMPSVYAALSPGNKTGVDSSGSRVNMWQQANFPLRITPATNSNPFLLNFLQTPTKNQAGGILGALNSLSGVPQTRPPVVSKYYHTSWYRKFS